ncbi:glycoside Hydrolase Family 73 [Oceanobacillus picturae]|uniref:Glycoside Hydrolase Family 73 n=1 Tax=Oceanobacillus picturae TaxID=171693 RepID=A0A0U9H5P7_9BACI|nr:phage tail family protein [Oceanobacillus picturae]GAQ18039.1 glycoside Hydrolase Family 73 [Oceanobacillus picturae]
MTIIQRLNGDTHDLKQLGIRTKNFIVSSPDYVHNTESLEGRPGAIDMGSTIGPRQITCEFKAIAYDMADFPLMRDEIFKLFRSDEAFYIIDPKNPGKRWLVKVSGTYELDQKFVYGDFSVQMVCNKGLAESIGTSLSPREWDVNLWQWGMGIPYDDYEYEHTTSNFTIYNAGTETIDPRFNDLVITIKATTSDYIEIINKTTGETYRYNGSLTSNDTLIIDGIRSTKNSLSVFRDTNKKLLTLLPGPNDIEVKGATVERILFDFRFLYL